MKTQSLPALAALLLLAGCLGYPPGSVRPGDSVLLRYSATDPATGAPVVAGTTVTAVAGQPSGLGADVDRALLGRHVNETFTVESRNPAGYTDTQSVSSELGRSPLENQVPTTAFEAQLGPARVGQVFRASALYNATVVAIAGGNVTYRLAVSEGQEIPIPSLGLKVVHHIEGSDLVRTLGPLPGATFSVEPTASGQTPLGLPAGSYRTRGLEGGKLVFDYSPVGADLFGKTLRFEVQVTAVRPGTAPTAPTGEYGHRMSPQVLGDASLALPAQNATA
ncbi:MAG: hypothetical protein QOI63_1990 [Thermoplasmata archaeon]|jgi:FKBP-type peptidyl-prolyl cis-trans isomerase 2|nr:hypothetical protein [Thermoplasmata archaeon]